MSERITEAELRDEERGTIHHNVMGTPVEGLSRERLVAEVRRLRGLIYRATEGPTVDYDELEAESDAIREEK